MALLLAMFQKMRLVREKNQATYQLATKSSKLSRVTKNIERIQKMYTSRISNLESQAKRMQNAASIFFQNSFGLGAGQISTNMYSYMGGGHLTGFMLNNMQGIIGKNIAYKDSDGTEHDDGQIDKATYEKLLNAYMSYGSSGFRYEHDDKGQIVYNDPETQKDPKTLDGIDAYQFDAFLRAIQTAQNNQSQAQMQMTTVNQQFQDNVSIWLEAQKEILEAQQDEALLPLNEEETMLELEKTSLEERLTRIKAELESYTQLVSEEAKDSAPKFGL